MNTLQLSKPYIPNNNRVNQRHSGSRAFIPIGKYLHSLSLPLRLAPPNVNTFTLEQVNITEWSKKNKNHKTAKYFGNKSEFFCFGGNVTNVWVTIQYNT